MYSILKLIFNYGLLTNPPGGGQYLMSEWMHFGGGQFGGHGGGPEIQFGGHVICNFPSDFEWNVVWFWLSNLNEVVILL